MRRSTSTEVLAGLTTFFTMAYIVVVNPAILSSPGTGMTFGAVLTATVLVCTLSTLLMGVYARLPFAVAPGMGLNAFFTFTIVLKQGVPWPVALGIVFWSGVLFLLVSATRLREAIAMAIPPSLRAATAAGIGLLLAFLGLRNAGLVVADPVTLVAAGHLDHRAALALIGLVVTAWLMQRQNPTAFLAGIFVVSAAGWALGHVQPPAAVVAWPDFSSVLAFDVLGALRPAFVPAMIAILFTDLFDSLSTFLGVSAAAGLLDENGRPRRLRQGLIVDAIATLGAGMAGSSPGTAYVESIAGIRMGGRTGLTAVVTALCFVPCLFVAPLASAVPAYATAPVLVLVGVAMFQPITTLSFAKIEEALPAYVAAVLIPLTSSITQGMLWGFLLHVLLFVVAGRRRDVHPVMYGLAAVSVALLWMENLRA